MPTPDGPTLFKPGFLSNKGYLGLKVVSVRNPPSGSSLPAVPGYMLLLDAQTGLAAGLTEATFLTALRTAAGSGNDHETSSKISLACRFSPQ